MNDEIKVGSYIRTCAGIITKAVEIDGDIVYTKTEESDNSSLGYAKRNITKHSPNILKVLENGDACSILAQDNLEYKFLKPISLEKDCPFFDHSGIKIGDIRVKVIDNAEKDILGNNPLVSMKRIKKNIEAKKEFYFLHYQAKEQGKVKKLGEKK